jgi:c-di-GMP-binding flagellar brake protein YcgR
MQGRNFVVGVQVRSLIHQAVEKGLPLTITNRGRNRWQVYKSSFLGIKANRLLLAEPIPKIGEAPLEPAENQEVAIAFKKGYHKCFFVTRIIGRTMVETDEGEHRPGFIALWPQQVEKLQRRAYNRAPAPKREPVTVSLRPISSDSASQAKCYGILHDLSAGGLGVIVNNDQVPLANEGQQFELWFVPLPGHEPLCLPASFRHATALAGGREVMLGFQLVGLELSEEGRGLLRWIGRIASVYQRQMDICEHPDLRRNHGHG